MLLITTTTTIGKDVTLLKKCLSPRNGKLVNLALLLWCARWMHSWHTTKSRPNFRVVVINSSPRPNSPELWQRRRSKIKDGKMNGENKKRERLRSGDSWADEAACGAWKIRQYQIPKSVTALPEVPLCETGSSPRCPLSSHSAVHSKNNSYFVGIEPQLKKELFEVCVVFKKYYLGSNEGWIL